MERFPYFTFFTIYAITAAFWAVVGALAFMSKGYSPWTGLASGFFLGLFSLLMLAIMEGQKKKQAAAQPLASAPQAAYPQTQAYFYAQPPGGQAVACPPGGASPAQFTTGQRLARAAIAAALLVVITYVKGITFGQLYSRFGMDRSIIILVGNLIFGLITWTVAGAAAVYPDWRPPALGRATLAGLASAGVGIVTSPLWGWVMDQFGYAYGLAVMFACGAAGYALALLVLDAGKINLSRLWLLAISLLISQIVQYMVNTGDMPTWTLQLSAILASALFALAVCWAPIPPLGEKGA